mmetsp:Transcript_109105/g.319326  ORF Transcript_109105/g.319326 Transcript_109105/m.319326 type:complete len:318 (+) Transcript_109105:1348-2301(+)
MPRRVGVQAPWPGRYQVGGRPAHHQAVPAVRLRHVLPVLPGERRHRERGVAVLCGRGFTRVLLLLLSLAAGALRVRRQQRAHGSPTLCHWRRCRRRGRRRCGCRARGVEARGGGDDASLWLGLRWRLRLRDTAAIHGRRSGAVQRRQWALHRHPCMPELQWCRRWPAELHRRHRRCHPRMELHRRSRGPELHRQHRRLEAHSGRRLEPCWRRHGPEVHWWRLGLLLRRRRRPQLRRHRRRREVRPLRSWPALGHERLLLVVHGRRLRQQLERLRRRARLRRRLPLLWRQDPLRRAVRHGSPGPVGCWEVVQGSFRAI